MEKALHSAVSKVVLTSPRTPYVIAVAFMILGLFETWRIYSLHTHLMAARETIRSRDWQVTEESERKSFDDLHLLFLDLKDPAYASSRVVLTWNGNLHQGLVTTQGLPIPPSGRDYQLWVLDPGEMAPINAGVLKSKPGSQAFGVHPVTTGNVGFAVTLEPAGGSPEPTSGILFAVTPGQW